MSTHDLSGEGVAARLEPIARRALAEYGVGPDAELTLLNVSENATYAVDDPSTGERTVLRVHRHGYHDGPAIESELAWLDALREDTGVRTPRVLPTADGRRLLSMPEDGQPDPRHVVRFEFLPGVEPEEAGSSLPASFELLGAITARMHEHALPMAAPAGVHALRLGLRRRLRQRRAMGALAGRHGHRCRGDRGARSAGRRAAAPAWHASGPTLTATAWCTPTSAWPTCSRTATRGT